MGNKSSIIYLICLVASVVFCGCLQDDGSEAGNSLRRELQAIVDSVPGKVGVAVITPGGDTVTINNDGDYQMMSVFKLHEALAVCHALDRRGVSLDTVISFSRSEMDPDTWSPMLAEHIEDELNLSVGDLLRYILQQSDNNASNLLFDRVVSVEDCDRFIREATGIEDFKITCTERQMHRNHALADGNHSSPLACARLIEKVFSDSIVSSQKQAFVQNTLLDCRTGLDRIYAPLKDVPGIALAHKTGSGFRTPEGILMAHNDVGRVSLPNGRSYVLAIMIKDFEGSESEASAVMAKISRTIHNARFTMHN